MIRRANRGRLKIFLGYGAGVGKTYQMLLEGHRLRAEGIDVVIGLLESHGRIDVERLAEGLVLIPRRVQEYRGTIIQEMDTGAIIGIKPQVTLIDELAHSNAPGSRNAKRYEDVEDILESGIHVVTTLNIQHLESLYDTVEREVGIKVRERIPDSVLFDADEIVNVDITPEDLQKRLKEGKIYPHERIQIALEHFFREANLETLRELTLRELAAQIDSKRREHVAYEDNLSPDQVMVCLSSRGPNSEMLLRYASRLAGRLNRNWYALYVQTPSEAPSVIDPETQEALSSALTLAKQLGALVFTHKGEDVVATILCFAREYRCGHIVIGSPGRLSLWKSLTGHKNLVASLIDLAHGATVVVLDTRRYDSQVGIAQTKKSDASKLGGATTATDKSQPFSYYLTTGRILFWDQPVNRENALRELVSSVNTPEIGNPDIVFDGLMRREQQSSTFLNEGVAFPHARLSGLSKPVVALGVARHGVSDTVTLEPVKLIFMILTPEESPSTQLGLLGEISHALKNRHLFQGLSNAKNPYEALLAFGRWETERGNAP
jgi:two-component system sensor histidine kinase KdpD